MSFGDSTKEGSYVEQAYGPEVNLFLHCHLRGYDRRGEGKVRIDYEYHDKYGTPVSKENFWEEEYNNVEKRLADHNKGVVDNKSLFPLVAGIGGGVHIDKSRHDEEPWNWTSWVPQQKRWQKEGCSSSNRYFLGLHGNEIQNNLWDYDPQEEEGDQIKLDYSQLEHNDRYRGGYWFSGQPFGRYLNIISLKSHEKHSVTDICPRYNYVAHPLAYRPSIATIPDNSVDAMQWAIINMPDERHFGAGKPWGEKCHGLEVYNDFTYFYSYQPLEKDGPYNGQLCLDPQRVINGDNKYYFWFDTYPLEYAVFLLESALARGVYFHTMTGCQDMCESSSRCIEGGQSEQSMEYKDPSDSRLGVLDTKQPKLLPGEKQYADSLDAVGYLKGRPYGFHTTFGFVTLLDPRLKIKDAVFKEENGIPYMGLNEGENLAMEYLRNGDFYATTARYNTFVYEDSSSLPYKISGQPDNEKLCYDITEDMELKFTFSKCTKHMAHLIWRYSIMFETSDNKLETSHGYFKLVPDHQTILDLRKKYALTKVKWLYFNSVSAPNPQHRMWFNAIRGPAFGEPVFHARLPNLKHNVVLTTRSENTVTETTKMAPTTVAKGDLDFALGTTRNMFDVCAYFMQVCPHQQDFSEPLNEKIKESSDVVPPRYLQSVHGYFSCKADHPTRVNLSASWDKKTVKDDKVYFYRINFMTAEPRPMEKESKPELFGQ